MLGAEDVKKIQIENSENPEVQAEVKTEAYKTPDETPNIPIQLAQLKIAELFGISSTELAMYDIELKRLIDYVDTFNPKTLDDIIFHTKHLNSQIGTVMGENKIKTISRYLFLTRERDYLERQMERMKGL